jgi:hypothetical protein
LQPDFAAAGLYFIRNSAVVDLLGVYAARLQELIVSVIKLIIAAISSIVEGRRKRRRLAGNVA